MPYGPPEEEGDWLEAAMAEAAALEARDRAEALFASGSKGTPRVQRPVVKRTPQQAGVTLTRAQKLQERDDKYGVHAWQNWYTSPSMGERCRVCGFVRHKHDC